MDTKEVFELWEDKLPGSRRVYNVRAGDLLFADEAIFNRDRAVGVAHGIRWALDQVRDERTKVSLCLIDIEEIGFIITEMEMI